MVVGEEPPYVRKRSTRHLPLDLNWFM